MSHNVVSVTKPRVIAASRRAELGLSIAEAAIMLGIPERVYARYEQGDHTCVTAILNSHFKHDASPFEPLHPLTQWRAKNGVTLAEASRRLKISHVAIRRYELRMRTPEWPIPDNILIMTDGEVDANAWLGKEAADVVALRQHAA